MLKRLQGFIVGFMVCAILFGTVAYAATQQSINVTYSNMKISVNGTVLTPDVEPFVYMNRTFVPARFIAEALGKDIRYNEITDTVEITDKAVSNTTGGTSTMNENTGGTFPYKNPLMVDSSTPPETIDGLSVYTVDGVQYVAADTKKDTANNDVTGFKSLYFENDTKYFIMFMGKTLSLRKYNPETEILSIPADKQHMLVINSVACFEYSFYKSTIEPLIKPVEETAP